jgi:hypothetical protein
MSRTNQRAQAAAPNRRAACLVIAVAAVIALGGCASKPKPATVDAARSSVATMKVRSLAVVDDTPRDKKVATLLGQVDQLVAAIHQNRVELDRSFSRLNADYSTPRDEFESELERFNSRQRQLQSRLVAVRSQLVQLTGSGEWTALSKPTDGSTPMLATVPEP